MSSWTAADIADLSGCSAAVTGTNSDTGFHAAREPAGHGARVVLAARDEARGAAAAGRVTPGQAHPRWRCAAWTTHAV
jgi:NAD(P)-dependent dehydrogenase (short-subunit alcohol dehydrogenase family)